MGFPPPVALLSPRDEDLHVNEDRRKRKICLSYGASVRKREGETVDAPYPQIFSQNRRTPVPVPHASGSMSCYLQPSEPARLLQDGAGARRLAGIEMGRGHQGPGQSTNREEGGGGTDMASLNPPSLKKNPQNQTKLMGSGLPEVLRTSARVLRSESKRQNLVRTDLQENPFFLPPKVSLLFLLPRLQLNFLSLSRSSKAKTPNPGGALVSSDVDRCTYNM